MLFCLILGFFGGIMIPFVAGRFGKIIPADPGFLRLRLFHWPRFPKVNDPMRRYLLRKMWKKLIFASLIWGILMAGLLFISSILLPQSFLFP